MRIMGRKIAVAVLFLLVVSAGVAYAQYNNPSTPSQPSGQSATINVANATVDGKSQPILVDGKGMSIYYLTSDTVTTSACTGGCAGAWPPLLAATAPTAPASATGKFVVVKTENGSQVSYNGHLLYRFGVDSKAGEVQGEGRKGPKDGVWHVATPDTKPAM